MDIVQKKYMVIQMGQAASSDSCNFKENLKNRQNFIDALNENQKIFSDVLDKCDVNCLQNYVNFIDGWISTHYKIMQKLYIFAGIDCRTVLDKLDESESDSLKREVLKKYIQNICSLMIEQSPIIKPWSPAICPNCGVELSESLGDGYYQHYKSIGRCKCGQLLTWNES